MQEQMPSHAKELICINVEKVYDWVVKDLSFEIFPTSPIKFKNLPDCTRASDVVSVTCQICPSSTDPVVIKNRENRTFTIDGSSVRLQQLTIQKNFEVTICVTLTNGMTYKSCPFTYSRNEHVVMCAPKGTNVDVTYTELDCFVSSTGSITNIHDDKITFSNLVLSISVCQSIQSTFPVTVEFLANYCEPRADISSTCSPPSRPDNCSIVFP
ncbi:hypothetical protein [Solibacillus daqui]|uniref:hypothetical protein n=1 Tax=Solibacillus daqui TaxID=2912187 RepID=UPI0023650363|nr:hypothetical protein [Solibacillus daqui]